MHLTTGEPYIRRAVVFDYGGTLVVERRPWDEVKPLAIHDAYLMMKRSGLALPYAAYMAVNDSVFADSAARELETGRDEPDLATYGRMVDRLFPRRSKLWRRNLASRSADRFWAKAKANFVLRRSAKKTLESLKGMGILMAVISNHHHGKALTTHLAELGISSYFTQVLASSSAGMRKPDERIFEACLATMGVLAQNSIYVGDSPENDVRGAHGAGMTTVLIYGRATPPRRSKAAVRPDFSVRDLDEIPRIAASHFGGRPILTRNSASSQ